MPHVPDPAGGQKLLDYVKGSAGDLDKATAAYDQAFELVHSYVHPHDDKVPAKVFGAQVLDVGKKLFERAAATGGQVQYDELAAPPVLTPRDPMIAAYPVLDRFLPGAFA